MSEEDQERAERIRQAIAAIRENRGELKRLREENAILTLEVMELRRQNYELRFNWIAAAEGDILDTGENDT